MAERKVADITPFGLRMQAELKRQLEAAARANNRSLNSEIIARLEQTLNEAKQSPKLSGAWTLEQRLQNLEQGIIKILSNEQEFEDRLAMIEVRPNKQST